ncbi:hypothetical protein K439DRAFT_1639741 [Ramaria rubella]|nr:hypothetical protein K439DRAFT_1639741 [Ramaria rubella]
MYFVRTLAALTILATSVAANSFIASVSYDNTYDNGGDSLSIVACSNGVNGLLTKGFTTFNSLPTFPNIGGAQAIAGWNSTNCGTCWSLTYEGKSINLIAIDTTFTGFNIAQEALDDLTGGRAVELGRVNVTAMQVPASHCGL